MTTAGFASAYKRVLVYEGGDVDDPHDPGGRTSRGVTQRVYDAWRMKQGKPKRDVYSATADEVKAIYRAQYWSAVQGDSLPIGVDLVLFDGAVNSGPKQSIKWLQAALGLQTDGVLGAVTLAALKADNDNDKLIAEINARRMGFLHKLSTFKYYGKGWSARVANVTKAGQAVANGTVGPKPVYVSDDGGNVKALVEDVKAPTVNAATGTSATGVGVTLETANETVQQVAGQVQGVADVSDALRYLFVGLTILGLIITAYALWRRSRSDTAISADARMDVPMTADEGMIEVGGTTA
jgi:lysozyme family protein